MLQIHSTGGSTCTVKNSKSTPLIRLCCGLLYGLLYVAFTFVRQRRMQTTLHKRLYLVYGTQWQQPRQNISDRSAWLTYTLILNFSYPNTIDCAHVSNLAVWKLWLLAGAFTVARVRVAVTTAATPKVSTVNNILLRWVLFVMLIFATHDLRAMYYYHTKPPIFQVWLD